MTAKRTTLARRPLSVAYEQMLFQPGIWATLGVAKQTILNARVKVRGNVRTTDVRKRRWLAKAGWSIVAEEQWAPTVEPMPLAAVRRLTIAEKREEVRKREQAAARKRKAVAPGKQPPRRPRGSDRERRAMSKEMLQVERWAQREFKKLKK